MAPLSRELAGLILPHQHFGSHLAADGTTVDPELEQANFAFAGRTLGEVWSDLLIDGNPVMAEYIDPDLSELNHDDLKLSSPQWRSTHVRESQYFTQIVKCSNDSCCKVPRSSYFHLMPSRFLPPPVPLQQTAKGLRAPDIGSLDSTHFKFPSVFVSMNLSKSVLPQTLQAFHVIPYDAYCTTVNSVITKRVCKNVDCIMHR